MEEQVSIPGCAEALLSQQDSRWWSYYDLCNSRDHADALAFLTRTLEEYEELLRKEEGWVERVHSEPVPVRTGEPNPYPLAFGIGGYFTGPEE